MAGDLCKKRSFCADGWLFQLWLHCVGIFSWFLPQHGPGTWLRSEVQCATHYAAVRLHDDFLPAGRIAHRFCSLVCIVFAQAGAISPSFALCLTAIFLVRGSQVRSQQLAGFILAGGWCTVPFASTFWSVSVDIAGRDSGAFSLLVNLGGTDWRRPYSLSEAVDRTEVWRGPVLRGCGCNGCRGHTLLAHCAS
jgi:hypothetical protein